MGLLYLFFMCEDRNDHEWWGRMQVNVSNELCDSHLGKQLCLESVPTGILGIMHIFGLSLF
jgi:hypothetical protein